MIAFRITYNPGQDRSMTKAQWKMAHRCARAMTRVLAQFQTPIDAVTQAQFKDLMLYGTARTVIHG